MAKEKPRRRDRLTDAVAALSVIQAIAAGFIGVTLVAVALFSLSIVPAVPSVAKGGFWLLGGGALGNGVGLICWALLLVLCVLSLMRGQRVAWLAVALIECVMAWYLISAGIPIGAIVAVYGLPVGVVGFSRNKPLLAPAEPRARTAPPS